MRTTPPARFTFLLDPELKLQFEQLCASQDITPSQLMRQMIKAHISGQSGTAARPATKRPVGRPAKR